MGQLGIKSEGGVRASFWHAAGLLVFCLALSAPALADGPLRGNPLDSLPSVERPGPAVPPAPVQSRPEDDKSALGARLQQRIVPQHFGVSGNKTIEFKRISAILEPLAGREMTVAQLVQEVNKITQLYQQEGYPLSFALLQEQDFAEGMVRVTVVEGHVSALRVEGDVGNAGERLQVLAGPLIAEKPLTRRTLERVLNLMRQVPGMRFTPRLDMPRRVDGATELVLNATHRTFGVSGGLVDMGTGMQGIVNLTANSLTPLGEQVKLTAAVPTNRRDVRYISGSVSVPVGSDGLSVEVDGYHYESRPEDEVLQSLGWDRRVVNERIGLGVSYPLLLNNRRLLSGSLGVYVAQTIDEYQRDADNAWLQQRAHTRVARASLRYREVGENQARDITVGINKGFDALGAKKSLRSNYAEFQPPAYDLDFTRYTLDFKQTVNLPAGFGLTLSGAGQYSRNILPNIEQTSFGAWRYGLGYPQGELAGDKGYGVSLEVNRRFVTGWRSLSTVQPYALVDHARAWYNDDAYQAYNGRSLSSAALGLRLTDDRYYVIDLNVAKPIGDTPLNSDKRSLRFNANYSLLYDGF